ncbi:MAG: hypothetical protein ABIJ97_05185 [Bacteroidota bacterium]
MAFMFLSGSLDAQDASNWEQFKKISRPEKWWVLLHPFIANKAFRISIEARKVTDNISNDRQLDGDPNGGQIDAFRHTYWMARLSQEIRPSKARKLGKAHEKGNKIDFKRHIKEEGTLPDSVSCLMDLLNNESGIKIGIENKTADQEILIGTIRKEIVSGNLKIIKKNIYGYYLTCNNQVLKSEDLNGIWNNAKCLVNSNDTPLKPKQQ